MYWGSLRMAAMTSAQVSSAVEKGEPEPSATAMPRSVQACTSTWLPTRPVCTISLSRGSLSMMARVKELEEENRRLKKMYAESQMDSAILKEALTKKW